MKMFRSKLISAISVKNQKQKSINQKQIEIDNLTINRNRLIKAKYVITEVQKLTQEKFKKRVESLVTLAIKSVFDRPFEFKLNFERKRNKLEILPVILEDGFELIPKEDDTGGGIIDIVSFAFRVVLWNLEKPKSRNVFLLDEPGKNIGKGHMLNRFGKMLREISHKLNFQIIMVTHELELANIADGAWAVSHNGIESNLKLIRGQ